MNDLEMPIFDCFAAKLTARRFITRIAVLDSGSTIRTGSSRLELVLVPNGSVIVIDENTTGNTFSLLTAKLRMIAARNTGSSYMVRTPTAVAGVRGTDFYRMYDPAAGRDWLCVTEGAVSLDSTSGTQSVLVSAGYFVNLTKGFQVVQPDDEWLTSNLTLEVLRGAVVPSQQ